MIEYNKRVYLKIKIEKKNEKIQVDIMEKGYCQCYYDESKDPEGKFLELAWNRTGCKYQQSFNAEQARTQITRNEGKIELLESQIKESDSQ